MSPPPPPPPSSERAATPPFDEDNDQFPPVMLQHGIFAVEQRDFPAVAQPLAFQHPLKIDEERSPAFEDEVPQLPRRRTPRGAASVQKQGEDS